MFKKALGVGAFLSFMGHCVMENRNCPVVASEVSQATGRAERDSALRLMRSIRGAHQKTLGADKGYDTRDFVADLRINGITPHVAQNIHARRSSAIDGRTARHQLRPIDHRPQAFRAGVWLGQTVSRPAATQSPRMLKGESRVSAACGGLQPDPRHQPAQETGGDGMKTGIREPKASPTRLRTTFSGPQSGRPAPCRQST